MVFQVHRRFQITFLSSSAVLEFIDAIRTICPCKANPIPGPGPAPGPVPPRNTTMAMQTFNPPSDTRMTPSYTTTVEQPRQDNPLSGLPSSLGPPLFPPRSIQEPTHGLQIPFSSSQGFALTSEPNVYQSSPLQGLASTSSQLQTHPIIQDLQKQVSLPNSSPPTSSGRSGADTNKSHIANSNTIVDANNSAILTSLAEATELYSLPRTTLEQLVGDIVREDGFVKLLESIDSMWRVKTFVGV